MTMAIGFRTDEQSPEVARVYRAAKAISTMGDDMDAELFRANPVLDALHRVARQAPLRSLTVAFVLGVMVACRR
jgi:hypothetical protein